MYYLDWILIDTFFGFEELRKQVRRNKRKIKIKIKIVDKLEDPKKEEKGDQKDTKRRRRGDEIIMPHQYPGSRYLSNAGNRVMFLHASKVNI